MSEQAVSGSRVFSRFWAAVAGFAVLLGIVVALFSLWDRVDTTQAFSGEISTQSVAEEFVRFAAENDGETVDLDLLCDRPDGNCEVRSGLSDKYSVLLWVFTATPCPIDPHGAPPTECPGSNAFWIVRAVNSDAIVKNGPYGAGSLVVRGEFALRDGGWGSGVFEQNVRNWYLTPVPLG